MEITDMSSTFIGEYKELYLCTAKVQWDPIVLNIYTGRSPEMSYLCAEFDLYAFAAAKFIK